MIPTDATDRWHSVHSGGSIGLLELSGVENQGPSPELEARKREVEARLRTRFAGASRADLVALPVMAAYVAYYKQFKKTYHVLLQLESIVSGARDLPTVSPLVDANFAAEVETLVLTAGHDADKLAGPLLIDVSGEDDTMLKMNGSEKRLRAGDMIMRDAGGTSCSIIYGQDARSPITHETSRALYVIYAPAGVPREAVEAQLTAIEEHVRLFSDDAVVEQRQILLA